MGFPGGISDKEHSCQTGDAISIPGLERLLGVGRKGNLICSLSWEIPQTVELGGLQSMGSQRVGHI